MRTTIAGSLALLALLTTGCAQTPLCPELDRCNSPDPIGSWALAPGYPSCTEDLYVPANDLRLAQGNKTAAMVAPPEPATYDWCDQLVASGSKLTLSEPNAFYESGQIGWAEVVFRPDGTYAAGATTTGTFVIDLPAACVRQFGTQDGRPINPDDPTSPNGTVCEQLSRAIDMVFQNTGAYFNTICGANPQDPQGCLCQFDVGSTGGPVGFWKRKDATTLALTNKNSFPSEINFCNRGSELQLTGANGDYLFGKKGLRTMKLKPSMAATP